VISAMKIVWERIVAPVRAERYVTAAAKVFRRRPVPDAAADLSIVPEPGRI
jgi:hypothetical protein